MTTKEMDPKFFFFLPRNTRLLIIDSDDIVGSLHHLGYNVPQLFKVFKHYDKDCFASERLNLIEGPRRSEMSVPIGA